MDIAPSESQGYPTPRIPLFPIPSWGTFFASEKGMGPSILDAKWILPVTYGRMAIGLALRDISVASGDEVLLPAYHCLSMVDPVRWTGATPVFYRVREDTSLDFADMKERVTSRTRAILVTHYFGFPQLMGKVRALCDEFGIVLIEDCAHALIGEVDGRHLGSIGDYAIASPMKFYPIFEGGILASDRRPLDGISLTPIGWKFALRAATTVLERSVQYRRLGPAGVPLGGLLWFKSALARLFQSIGPNNQPSPWGPPVGGHSSGQTGDFDPQWIRCRMSSVSQWVIRHASRSRMALVRRENYRFLLDRLAGLPGSRPVFQDLPPGVVPFAFPLAVNDPAPVFHRLKTQGVPIMRFGEYLSREIDERTYPDTIHLSRNVLQFPCHQELRQGELQWMAEAIRESLQAAPIEPKAIQQQAPSRDRIAEVKETG